MTKEIKKTEETKQTSAEPKQARRKLFGSGLAAASAMFGLVAAACSDDDEDKTPGGDGSVPAGKPDGSVDAGLDSGIIATPDGGGDAGAVDADVTLLNALLTAEHKAIAAYTAGAGLIAAAPSTDPLITYKDGITKIAVHFQDQHKLHRDALIETINGLKGAPVTEAAALTGFAAPAVLTGNPTILNVLKFAAGAERQAAIAYNEVVSGLEAAKNRFLATIIEGDESQHFIVLTAVIAGLVDLPAPAAFTDAAVALVVPQAFVYTRGANKGLNEAPPNFF
jgi:hypothetical protein